MFGDDSYSKAVKLCYEATLGKYTESGLPLFYLAECAGGKDRKDIAIYLCEVLRAGTHTEEELEKDFGPAAYRAAKLFALEEDDIPEGLQTIRKNERLRETVYRKARQRYFYGEKEAEEAVHILNDKLYEIRSWDTGNNRVRIIRIYDRNRRNAEIFYADHENNKYANCVYTIREESLQKIKGIVKDAEPIFVEDHYDYLGNGITWDDLISGREITRTIIDTNIVFRMLPERCSKGITIYHEAGRPISIDKDNDVYETVMQKHEEIMNVLEEEGVVNGYLQ